MVSHHTAEFGGPKDCGSRDIIVLLDQVILKNHMIEELCDFMGETV